MINQASGIFFYSTKTKSYLYLLRSDKNPTWSIPGGKLEKDETLFEGMARECREEIGIFENNWKLIPIQKFVNNSFIYNTFFCEVENEFIPILNDEHCGFAWMQPTHYPKPLHPGLFSTVNIDIVLEKLKSLEGKK